MPSRSFPPPHYADYRTGIIDAIVKGMMACVSFILIYRPDSNQTIKQIVPMIVILLVYQESSIVETFGFSTEIRRHEVPDNERTPNILSAEVSDETVIREPDVHI